MSLQTGRSQHSYTFDAATELQDSAVVTTSAPGEVGAAAQVVDLGSAGIGDNAYVAFDLVCDVSLIDDTTGDEFYQIVLQLSDSATFASGVFNKAIVAFGVAGGLVNSGADGDYVDGRRVVSADNEMEGTTYRYCRVNFVTGGTTPIMTPHCWLSMH